METRKKSSKQMSIDDLTTTTVMLRHFPVDLHKRIKLLAVMENQTFNDVALSCMENQMFNDVALLCLEFGVVRLETLVKNVK